MSKNKYVRGSYKYINIYNDWDDPSNTDFWLFLWLNYLKLNLKKKDIINNKYYDGLK